jgi:hypothetical protein
MRTAFIIFIVMIAGRLVAQTTISGIVRDRQGNPIPGANVMIVNSYDGSTTTADGSFSFETNATGPNVLLITFIGYKEHSRSIIIGPEKLNFSITLEEKVNELAAVSISAGAFTASDESRRTIFRAVDIATTAGATADIAGALNTLPGTQKVGESGRLFVRGGDGNETRTFIDGLVVLDAYSPSAPNTPSRGRFLPFMFKGTSFSTGGYSSEYGQALSSALVLDSRDKAEMTRTDLGILSVGGDVAHTQAWESGSVAGKLQYTNIRPYFGLLNQEIDWKNAPVSTEGSMAFRQQLGKTGLLKTYGNFNNTNFSLYNHSIDDYNEKQLVDLTNHYRYLNTFYKTAINDNWMVRGGLSYTNLKNTTLSGDNKILDQENGYHGKIAFEGSLHEQIELRSGAEIISREHVYNVENTSGEKGFNETITAVFAEADLYASNAFVTRIGGRMEHNNMEGTVALDPRISLAYKITTSDQVSFAYGRFRQSVKKEWLRLNNELESEKAEHFILNYQRVENNRIFRVEGYYKNYDDLLLYSDPSLLTNNGSGYARGAEIFWRDNESFKRSDYWLSYSFLDTERTYLNFSESATPSFASRHNFSAVYKYFIQRLRSQVGTTYSFSSPRPFHDPNQEGVNKGRTPAYHDLSFNWSYLPKPWLIVYASCTNVTGRDNIFGYEYGTSLNANGEYNRRAIRQPAPRFLFIGIFITFSKEKSVNQLPTL